MESKEAFYYLIFLGIKITFVIFMFILAVIKLKLINIQW